MAGNPVATPPLACRGAASPAASAVVHTGSGEATYEREDRQGSTRKQQIARAKHPDSRGEVVLTEYPTLKLASKDVSLGMVCSGG